ncbi:MAG: cyclic nucleotide-binding domain-containing protein [Symplocastrum torsivum CPER-KK1]|jgi:bacteriocin-type transport-associated protein|uniref:Cyclic nucleotide-binding domain-containing protein n=1 Tax=Symplocastrum torsivum CPER-KK1 TaxID=450513 RepID=A0A951PIX9_9CYAN|nr:cyclic nucleotide-binding domain-containing protein [Microcoleus sp. FACHB-SPT15]MBD1806019.1 cyclic nucleotide-binding domain-containing protein [Microcoleus sp. FACHB-SPT15]MBW4544357.1 cyclic nucleotide-binding domain-containing protein [Symplocastrum torsivum CPER-KK1]
MKKVFFLLGELDDDDIDWMVSSGRREEVEAGTVLIQEGQAIDTLHILLEGTLSVSVSALEGKTIARLTSGAVVGEMSFADARPPSATVQAVETSLVLSIPRQLLIEKLQEDQGFASRFYRAIAIFLSTRLRGTVRYLGYAKDQLVNEDNNVEDLSPEMIDNVPLAKARFDWLLRRLRSSDYAALPE